MPTLSGRAGGRSRMAATPASTCAQPAAGKVAAAKPASSARRSRMTWFMAPPLAGAVSCGAGARLRGLLCSRIAASALRLLLAHGAELPADVLRKTLEEVGLV